MLNLGIVGSGAMGRVYAESLKFCTGVELTAVAGGSRAEQLAKDFGAEFVPAVDDLIASDNVDAVLLATPHQVHPEETFAAAEHGKHVLVEKPMATTVADCDAMIASCKKAGVVLSVIKTLRYWNTMSKTKELIDEGRIGTVRMIQETSLIPQASGVPEEKRWYLEPEAGGSLLDRGSHIFDMLRWLTDDDAVQVYGHAGSFSKEQWFGLTAMAQIQFSRGATAQVWMSHEVAEPGFPGSRYRFRIWGDTGLIDCDAHGPLRIAVGGEWEDVLRRQTFDPTEDLYTRARLEGNYPQIQDFADAIREERAPEVSAEAGRAAVEMVQATYLSSLSGTAVNLPLPRAQGGFQFDGATVPRDMIPGDDARAGPAE